MIKLNNITKKYKNGNTYTEALKGVSLEINESDIFGVIGYSGSGKSTLIRCINLLEKPDSGDVEVDGKDLLKLSSKELRIEREKIGMIFQHFNLLKSDTVFDNVALPLKYKKMDKAKIREKVYELLNLVGLYDKKDSYPSQLSGGQKQRVSIARALATEPKILLSDESTSALDPQTTESILELLKNLNEKLGITIVVITHEMQVIKDICNKVAVLEEGRIIEEGNTIDVFTNPKEKTTKEFVSSVLQENKIYSLVKNNLFDKQSHKVKKLMKLIFSGESANEAYISYISITFKIKASIVYGNIEVIQGSPLGCLFVAFDGEITNINNAITYLKNNGVRVYEIKEDNNENIE